MKKKVALHTLGCKLNQVDTEIIRESFERAGYDVVDFQEHADVYVVNACTVTGKTDQQVRKILRRAIQQKDKNPDVKVVVTGCYAQTQPEELKETLPGLDLIVGTLNKERIPEILEEIFAGNDAFSGVRDVFEEKVFRPVEIDAFSEYSRAFLKIQEGCNNRCSYCIVPYARGSSRSAEPEDVVKQAMKFADGGFREIVLVGIHIGRYGMDLSPRTSLASLLALLNQVEGIDRIRLSSIDPKEFSEELYDVLNKMKEKVCAHFHISLQSGDDEILEKMRRDYTAQDFEDVVVRLRQIFPEVSIGADVIVGFPGESFDAFHATCTLVKKTQLSYMHIFRYSQRPGTPAADMPEQVTDEVMQLRSRKMHDIRIDLERTYREAFVGREVEVVLEQRRVGENRLTGLTRTYVRVFGDGPDELMGKLVRAKIVREERGGLEAGSFRTVD